MADQTNNIYSQMEKLNSQGRLNGCCVICTTRIRGVSKQFFKPASFWVQDYRAVLVDENGKQTLSPVVHTAERGGADFRDAREAALLRSDSFRTGYFIHARCWDLLNIATEQVCRRTPLILPEDRLESFTRALVDPALDVAYRDLPNATLRDWVVLEKNRRSWIVEDRYNAAGLFVDRDPFVNKRVRRIITEFLHDSKRGSNDVEERGKVIVPGVDTILPVELKFLVFDFLGLEALRQPLESGEWGLPDSYWKTRLLRNKDLFELRDLATAENVDWQRLWCKLGLIETISLGLANRRHIMRLCRGISSKFIEMDEEDEEDTSESQW
ncbi:hypothetical protein FQN54_004673 [Arachnomyces sp. PD_36]|nr:hypothetical protein FQN54_004673 [Arachnomyces sp. PD_36]